MTDLQLYSFLMFWAGALLTRVVFYIEKKWKEQETYRQISVSLIKFLWLINYLESARASNDPVEDLDRNDKEMTVITELLIGSLSKEQKLKIDYGFYIFFDSLLLIILFLQVKNFIKKNIFFKFFFL